MALWICWKLARYPDSKDTLQLNCRWIQLLLRECFSNKTSTKHWAAPALAQSPKQLQFNKFPSLKMSKGMCHRISGLIHDYFAWFKIEKINETQGTKSCCAFDAVVGVKMLNFSWLGHIIVFLYLLILNVLLFSQTNLGYFAYADVEADTTIIRSRHE